MDYSFMNQYKNQINENEIEKQDTIITFFKIKETLKKSQNLSPGSIYFVYAHVIMEIFQYFDYGVFTTDIIDIDNREQLEMNKKMNNSPSPSNPTSNSNPSPPSPSLFLDQSTQEKLIKLMKDCLSRMNMILPEILELTEHDLEELRDQAMSTIKIKQSFWDTPVPQKANEMQNSSFSPDSNFHSFHPASNIPISLQNPSSNPLSESSIPLSELLIPRSRLSISFCQVIYCFRILYRNLRALNRSSSKTKCNAGYLDSLSRKIEELQMLKEKNDILTDNRIQSKSFRFIFQISPKDIAEQVTLIHFNVYEKIRENELYDIAWMKLNNSTPNVHAFLNLSIYFTNVFVNQIISFINQNNSLTDGRDEKKKRGLQIISHLISVCRHFYKLDNYQGIWIILHSLLRFTTSSPSPSPSSLPKISSSKNEKFQENEMSRMEMNRNENENVNNQSIPHLDLSLLPKSDLVTLENFTNLLSSNRNYIIYRNHMKNKSKAIPVFAVLDDDLRAVDVGLVDSNHGIKAICNFLQYQNSQEYKTIQNDNAIQHWLLNSSCKNEDQSRWKKQKDHQGKENFNENDKNDENSINNQPSKNDNEMIEFMRQQDKENDIYHGNNRHDNDNSKDRFEPLFRQLRIKT